MKNARPLLLLAIAAMLLPACSNPAPSPVVEAVEADASNDAVLFEGARVFDGERDLGVIDFLVEHGRIVAIGEEAAGTAAETAERIDLGGRYVVPGLIAAHSHVGNTDGTEQGDRFYTRDNVLRNLRQFQAYGVTTVGSLGMNGPAFYDIRSEVAGDPTLGARLLGAGAGIGVSDGAPPAAGMGLENDPVLRPSTADDARDAVRRQAEAGVDLIKIWVDDLGGSAPIMAGDVYRAIIDEAHARGLKVVAHIHDLEAARALVEAGVDIIGHGVRDTAVDDAFIQALRSHGTWYIPTVNIDEANGFIFPENPQWLDDPFLTHALQAPVREQFADPEWRAEQLASPAAERSRAAVATNLRNLQALHDAGIGIGIGFGTDSGATPRRVIGFAEHRELELYVSAGFSPAEALTAATRNSALLLGLEDGGLLQAGRRADFVVLSADPLDDIRNTRQIEAVWQQGRKVSGPVSDYRAD